ncbi:MAG: hypothetical protein V4813_07910 [Gemmatimonadota bacterium]
MSVPLTAMLVTTFEPWSVFYANSVALATALTFVHLGAMMVGGGMAVSADRLVLRARIPVDAEASATLADTLGSVHRPVVMALLVSLSSGLLQLAADLEALLPNRVLWIKLSLLVLLVANGALMLRDERALRRDPRDTSRVGALRRRAITSLVLWLAVVLAGAGLMQG